MIVWLVGYANVGARVCGVVFTNQDDGPLVATRVGSKGKFIEDRAITCILRGGEEIPELDGSNGIVWVICRRARRRIV